MVQSNIYIKKRSGRTRRCLRAVCKRGADILFALVGLLFCFPLFCLIALGIRLTSRGPILFRQVRMGRGLTPFLLYKFRTMACTAPHDAPTAAICSCAYITRFGAFLRKTSLDELPQLYNILRGDMSIIGPRPVVLTECELITRRADAGVYRVRPGLSGLAQVLGRDLLNDPEKTSLDRLYVRHQSLFFDLRLILLSLSVALRGHGIREGKGG